MRKRDEDRHRPARRLALWADDRPRFHSVRSAGRFPALARTSCRLAADPLSREPYRCQVGDGEDAGDGERSEELTSELQSLMRISYAVFCLKKKNKTHQLQRTERY